MTKSKPWEWGETKKEEERAKGVGVRQKVNQGSEERLNWKSRGRRELGRDKRLVFHQPKHKDQQASQSWNMLQWNHDFSSSREKKIGSRSRGGQEIEGEC